MSYQAIPTSVGSDNLTSDIPSLEQATTLLGGEGRSLGLFGAYGPFSLESKPFNAGKPSNSHVAVPRLVGLEPAMADNL